MLGVLLHPARDGAGIAAAGQVYGITHGLQATTLLLAVSLASTDALDADSFGGQGPSAMLTAMGGTLWWFRYGLTKRLRDRTTTVP
jgi:hypothetical protein